MATNSNIVTDEDIANTKRNIQELIAHRKEAEMAIKANILDKSALAAIDAAIEKGKLFIKVYTGENYTP